MQERTNQRAESSLGIFSARPGRGFPLRATSPPPLHGRQAGLVTAGREGVGWRCRDLLAELESGPGVGIQRWWQKTLGSSGRVGLVVESWGGEKPSGRRERVETPLWVKKVVWGAGERRKEKTAKSPPKCRRGAGGSPPPAAGPSGAGVGPGERRWGGSRGSFGQAEGAVRDPGGIGCGAAESGGGG